MTEGGSEGRPEVGEFYDWAIGDEAVRQAVTFRVTRVARDGSWADIAALGGVYEDQVLWTKRQPWPLDGAERRRVSDVTASDAIRIDWEDMLPDDEIDNQDAWGGSIPSGDLNDFAWNVTRVGASRLLHQLARRVEITGEPMTADQLRAYAAEVDL